MAKEKLVALENDLMFASVMQHEKACIKLLQAIFPNKEIDKIEYDNNVETFTTELDVQKFIQLNPFEKSIRLDLPYDVQDIRMHHTPLGPPRVIFASNCSDEALLALKPQSSRSIHLEYPQSRSSISAITYAFLGDKINPAALVHYLDAHVSRADNLHFWAMHMLSRLKFPVLLDESHATLMRKRVFNNIEPIIQDFARRGTIDGFKYLYDLDFFNEETIQRAIDISAESKNAHSTSFLLELQEKSFGRKRTNFDL